MSSETVNQDYAIEVSGLGKCYQIYSKPSDRLKQMLVRGRRQYFKEFWALRDVSFRIRKNETVAIIGRNGSGKSTLLQIICGTLNPTGGEVKVNGRVAALLELGAGFNPEFTGIENVYMAASLYGLSRTEVDQRLDAIAAFADIGAHLHQPVKTYSSGMYVRLAFAVIAHVDADILVVDEALAVGDAVFTQKCMRFIRKFRETGTLLFVSHDMHSVLNLCQHAVWLHHGRVRDTGPAKSIAEKYLQYTLQEVYGQDAELESLKQSNVEESEAGVKAATTVDQTTSSVAQYGGEMKVHDQLCDANGWKSGGGEIVSVALQPARGSNAGILQGGERVILTIRAVAHQSMDRPILGFLVRDRLGQDLFGENTLPFTSFNPCSIKQGSEMEGEFEFTLPMLPNGQYVVMASLAEGDLVNNIQHHWLHDALVLNVSSSKVRWGLVGVPFNRISLSQCQ